MRINAKFRACRSCLLLLFTLLPSYGAAANHSIEMDPILPGPYSVACSNLAHDSGKLKQLGGTLDDYWSGNKGHYMSDILLEPGATLQINPSIPDEGLYPGRRNTSVGFVIIVCYPTDAVNPRPDYVLPDGQLVPKMQRTGQLPILPDQPCMSLSPVPAGCGRWPLLAFVHGIGSSPLDSYSIDFLLNFARQGYIVAAAFHGDGRFLTLKLEDSGDLLYLIKNFDRFVELQALRPLAVKSMIDAMLADPGFGGKIDPERIGGIGVSLGGETMTLLLGAEVTDDYLRETSVKTVTDPRIKAAVGYIPYAGQKYLPAFGKGNATTRNVNVPYLAISGVDDGIAPMYRMEEVINNFRSASFQVGLPGVAHEYDSAYAADIFGWAIPFLTSYLDCSSIGQASQARFMQQLNVRGGLDDQLLVSHDAPALCFAQGWNLLGNGSDMPIDVATTFSDSTRFQAVWKWNSSDNAWAFFSPALAIQGGTVLADYVAAKGYQRLSSIAGGEGYWVYAKQAGSINIPSGALIAPASFKGISSGWHLISTGDNVTPRVFNADIGTASSAAGAGPQNIQSLWAWDSTQRKWYFYAPTLEAQGGNTLTDYIANHGLLDFISQNKTLGLGVGFWVKQP